MILRGPDKVTGLGAGLMAFTVAFVAVWLAFGGPQPYHRKYELKAIVESGSELHSRTPVRIAGVDVGKVKKVERGPGSLATVTMVLEQRALPIHTDATVKIRPRIFLEGNFFLDLGPGTPSAPLMKRGGTIPLAQTATPVQLDQILSTLRRSNRRDLADTVKNLGQALDRGGAQALNASLPSWAPAFVQGSMAIEALRGQSEHDLSGLISSSQKLATALADRKGDLADAVTGLARTSVALASRREQLAQSIPEFDALEREARPAFAALNNLFPTARQFVADARPGIREAPATLRLANPLLAQLQGLLGPAELPALLRIGTPAIRALARLQPHLRALLAQVDPAVVCVRDNVLPVLKDHVDDPPLTTGRAILPIYRELLNGLVGQASGSQNFDGNGPALRYHAGFGDQSFGTGFVPSVGGAVVGVTSEPLLGSRPRFTMQIPPYRGDVPCRTQKRVNLAAETGPAFGGPAKTFVPKGTP
ncbi:MAG: phospholipid/cholesterol/gamma-HCH transport system substrate-binding protein [Thermoleophilaceae bacterium]|jgi:phospholipid/cholesterol/gamma-HCH transport system substrate-binding protein|nr:phospholipid/cholesterol/gamma-HCH transport system substrate-binding protein [Thermoleophilaceae bacterium]